MKRTKKVPKPPKPEVVQLQPCLAAFNHPKDGLVVMLDNNEFEAPGVWGVVLADIVQHLVNAYTKDGMSPREVRASIVDMLNRELNAPTAKAVVKDAEFVDGGFILPDDEPAH